MLARLRLLTPAAVAVLAVAAPTTASAASTTTITACVKARTGAFKILSAKQARRRCAKGYTKVTWGADGRSGTGGANGRSGATGRDGANAAEGRSGLVPVRDGAGNVLGTYAGTLGSGYPGLGLEDVAYVVRRQDGGLYNYLASGVLAPSDLRYQYMPLFRDPACTGAAYFGWRDPGSALPSPLPGVGDASRWVYRPLVVADPFDPVVGPARVWKFTTATMTVPRPIGPFYLLDSSGACLSIDTDRSGPLPGQTLTVMQSIPAPPDGAGPLVVG